MTANERVTERGRERSPLNCGGAWSKFRHAQRSRSRRQLAHAGPGRGGRSRPRPGVARRSAGQRARLTRSIVEGLVAKRAAAYGVTTGFGKLSEVAIPPERLAELQVNLVRSHAAGVGDLLPEREVRAMMLLRANVITKGYSGARLDLAELLVAMLNAGLCPPIPEQGSVGASGDLAPLAHLALSLIGEGTLNRGERVRSGGGHAPRRRPRADRRSGRRKGSR